jgi:hypothetical protein
VERLGYISLVVAVTEPPVAGREPGICTVCSLAPGSLLIPGSCSVEISETGEALEGEDCVDDDNSLLVPVADTCSGP